MTKDRGAEELCLRASILFDTHPEWRSMGSDTDRFIRVDPENSYRSTLFMQCASKYGYRIEPALARDKHANGTFERTVGTISAKKNLHMLAPTPTPRVPGVYAWSTLLRLCHLTTVENSEHHHTLMYTVSM